MTNQITAEEFVASLEAGGKFPESEYDHFESIGTTGEEEWEQGWNVYFVRKDGTWEQVSYYEEHSGDVMRAIAWFCDDNPEADAAWQAQDERNREAMKKSDPELHAYLYEGGPRPERLNTDEDW